MSNSIALEQQYAAKNIVPARINLVKGEGCYVYDQLGDRYLDMASAVAVTAFGHCHPRLLKALNEQAQKITATSRLFYNDTLGPFLKLACELTGYDRGLAMNSGAEAIETALKAVRKWAYLHKGIPADQAEIIVCADNFHGRTITTISMSSQDRYRQFFGAFTPGFKIIPFNDPVALQQAINEHTAAFLVEPIQGEGGVNIPEKGYLQACAKICQDNQVLLVCDEIQTGMGRTGTLLACQHDEVMPDAVILGKALGGGILPVSLFLAKKGLMDVFEPGDHGSTFGGNPLAAAIAKEALQLLIDDHLIENALRQGDYFLEQLSLLNSPLITSVRGKGLMLAIDINTQLISSEEVGGQLRSAGLLTINTRNKCLRLLPALTITRAQIDEALNILRTCLC